MRVSLGYTLLRHRLHLFVGALRYDITYKLVPVFTKRRGVPADTFDALARDWKRSREAITRINSIRRAM